jgi:hypothetical protein
MVLRLTRETALWGFDVGRGFDVRGAYMLNWDPQVTLHIT